jgi:hypothetical protein
MRIDEAAALPIILFASAAISVVAWTTQDESVVGFVGFSCAVCAALTSMVAIAGAYRIDTLANTSPIPVERLLMMRQGCVALSQWAFLLVDLLAMSVVIIVDQGMRPPKPDDLFMFCTTLTFLAWAISTWYVLAVLRNVVELSESLSVTAPTDTPE